MIRATLAAWVLAAAGAVALPGCSTCAACPCATPGAQRVRPLEARSDAAQLFVRIENTNAPCCTPAFRREYWVEASLAALHAGDVNMTRVAAPKGWWLVIDSDGSIGTVTNGIALLPVASSDLPTSATRAELYSIHVETSGEFRGSLTVPVGPP